MKKPSFEEQYPGYKLTPAPRRWPSWALTWLAFGVLLIGAPGVVFYMLNQLQVPTANQSGLNRFSVATFGRLAERQSQTGNHQEAVKNFSSYFILGGQDADMMAQYAYSLSETGQREEALKWSRAALEKSPTSKAARLVHDALEKK